MSGIVTKREGSPFWYITKTRESCKTKDRKKAEEFARARLREVWDEEMLGEQAYKFAALADEYLDAKRDKRNPRSDRYVMHKFAAFLAKREMSDWTLLQLSKSSAIRDYAKQVRLTGRKSSTVNNHIQTLMCAFRLAKKRQWIMVVPDVDKLEVPKAKPRWLTPEELTKVLAHLQEWIAHIAVMAVQTGMRYSNVAGLRWSWLNDDMTMCRVPATHTKTKRMYTVPLNPTAREVLEKRKTIRAEAIRDKLIPSDCDLVFWNPDRPGVYQEKVAFWWKKAFKAAGIPYCKFHGLRHTWASWHIQNETPDRVIQEIAGWASGAQLQRYAHLNVEHLTKYADNLNGRETRRVDTHA